MAFKSIIGAACTCLVVVTFNVNAALIERLGGLAYYDDVADLTWLADGNAAVGSAYDTAIPGTGIMNQFEAAAWAAGLDVAGVTGWRLPGTIDVGNDGYTYTNQYEGVDYGYNITTDSELSNMFYNVLGNTARYDTSGVDTGCYVGPDYCLTNTGPFSNLQSSVYWSATEYAPQTGSAWYFDMAAGGQSSIIRSTNEYAWAVYDGDVALSAVPIPAAVWLFGSGLIGLIGLAKRKS